MGKNFTTAFALCLAISALPLACGDDEEDDGGGKGGKGGSAGSNTGGRAGSTTGGRSGSGGSTSTGGRAGSGGSGVTGGSAGSATGGMGGADGGMGGDDGGMGGEGGTPVEPPMTPCEQACAGPPGTCQATCVADWCADLNANPGATCDPLIEAMVLCFAGDDAAASWTCTAGTPQYAGTDCVDAIYAAYGANCL